MIINHNLTSLSAVNASRITHSILQKSIQPLATGLRINSAADDASGIAISEKMRSQTAGYTMAIRNVQDGISLLQTAEGGLGEADSMLQRMRELAVQAGNDTLTSQDRAHIQEEVEELKTRLNSIAERTQFNTKRILDGSSGLLWSSNDVNLQAVVRGGASLMDRPEGSYRIQIKAEPGKAHVQTSSFFDASTLTRTEHTVESDDDEAQTLYVYSETANTLSEIPQFYTSDGAFIVSEAQALKIIQGNGKIAGITLYGQDTLYDVSDKINSAIADSLGQGQYVDNAAKFSTVAEPLMNPNYDSDGEISGYTLKAGLVIQSAIPGQSGELYFSGNDDLLEVLGLSTTQKAQDSTYTINIYDADTGESLLSDVKITGSVLHGVIGEGIDVEFDPMAGTLATWQDGQGQYVLTGSDAYSAVMTLQNSGIIFQVGTNQAENFAVQFGGISAGALGVEGVNVMTSELASRAVGAIDEAIDSIVKQRTQIVSYSTALEHTAANLASSGANLTQARSRITDADEAKSTMRFIEFQILSHGQELIIASANQQPEAVYSLLNTET